MNQRPASAPTARTLAARVLSRVLRDGAFAAAALDAELSRTVQLDPRERGLATEIVYGVLRTLPALEARLNRLAPKGIKDFNTRVILLVAAYQLLLLDRVPAFAAVDAAVGQVRAERGEKVAGFANAVLRKLVATKEHLTTEQALRESAPAWLFERLSHTVGESEAAAAFGAEEAQPRSCVRLVSGRSVPSWLENAEIGRVSPRARKVERRGDPASWDGYSDGAFVLQEEGAQAIALLLGARPGERVLDACAGRGQKTTLLRELVGPSGHVLATDVHPNKLTALEREFERLELAAAETAAVDWSLGTARVPADFDRVLVDAPCTGTGTLRHRPEILRRLKPEDPSRLGELATKILRSAATRAKPGGRVVFAVCSLLTEEAESVVAAVSDLLQLAPFDAPELAAWLPTEASTLRLLPKAHGTDGYFVASFLRA